MSPRCTWRYGSSQRPDSRRTIDGLVHQQEIADEQCALHRFRRDAEGLQDEGKRKERDDEDGKQGAYGFEQVGKDQVSMLRCRARDAGVRQRL